MQVFVKPVNTSFRPGDSWMVSPSRQGEYSLHACNPTPTSNRFLPLGRPKLSAPLSEPFSGHSLTQGGGPVYKAPQPGLSGFSGPFLFLPSSPSALVATEARGCLQALLFLLQECTSSRKAIRKMSLFTGRSSPTP